MQHTRHDYKLNERIDRLFELVILLIHTVQCFLLLLLLFIWLVIESPWKEKVKLDKIEQGDYSSLDFYLTISFKVI